MAYYQDKHLFYEGMQFECHILYMVTCNIVQLGANTILNYLEPFLHGLLKSSVKYILVYKILMHSSHCSICKFLVFRRGKPGKAHSTQTVSLRSCSTKQPELCLSRDFQPHQALIQVMGEESTISGQPSTVTQRGLWVPNFSDFDPC